MLRYAQGMTVACFSVLLVRSSGSGVRQVANSGTPEVDDGIPPDSLLIQRASELVRNPSLNAGRSMIEKGPCCRAMTATCMACAADMTVEEYCSEYPNNKGCSETKPMALPAGCSDDAGWTDKDGYGCALYDRGTTTAASCLLQKVNGVMKGTVKQSGAYYKSAAKPGQKTALQACKACGKCNPEGPLMRASSSGFLGQAGQNYTHMWVAMQGSAGWCGIYEPKNEVVDTASRTTTWTSWSNKDDCKIYPKNDHVWSLKCHGVDVCSYAAEGVLPPAGEWACTDGSRAQFTHFRDDWVPMVESNPDSCWKNHGGCWTPRPAMSRLCRATSTPTTTSAPSGKGGAKRAFKQCKKACKKASKISTASKPWVEKKRCIRECKSRA